MAMGEEKGQEATRQVAMVCLDELVPADDRYRRLDELIDWGFVRECSRPYYAESVGRPSIDPIVLVKLVWPAPSRASTRCASWCARPACASTCAAFLATAFTSTCRPTRPSPTPTRTLRRRSALRTPLYAFGGALRRARSARRHAPLGGRFPRRGRRRPARACAPASGRRAPPEQDRRRHPQGTRRPPSAQLALAAPRSGKTPKRRSSNATAASLTDPEARLRGKPGQRPHLVHRGQVAVDPRARCVVACQGERADGYEGDALAPLTDRAHFAWPDLVSVGADQGFAASRVWRALEGRLRPSCRPSAACCPRR